MKDIAERVKTGPARVGAYPVGAGRHRQSESPYYRPHRGRGGRARLIGHCRARAECRELGSASNNRGVRPKAQADEFDMERYLDSLYGDARSASPKQLEVLIAGEHAGNFACPRTASCPLSTAPVIQAPIFPSICPTQPTSIPEDGYSVPGSDNLLPDNPQVRKGMAEEAGTSMGVFPLLTHFGFDLPGADPGSRT